MKLKFSLTFTNLEKGNVIVMHYIQIVLWMWKNALYFDFLPIICMWISTRYAQLDCPTINIVQRFTEETKIKSISKLYLIQSEWRIQIIHTFRCNEMLLEPIDQQLRHRHSKIPLQAHLEWLPKMANHRVMIQNHQRYVFALELDDFALGHILLDQTK